MLTPRNFIATAIIIAVVSVVSAGWSLLRTIAGEGGEFGSDSFGVYSTGYRALFETLSELSIPVRRSTTPPNVDQLSDSVFVLWRPDLNLAESEPRWLTNLSAWIKDGGELIVALDRTSPATLQQMLQDQMQKAQKSDGDDTTGRRSVMDRRQTQRADRVGDVKKFEPASVFELLGLKDVELYTVPPMEDHAELEAASRPQFERYRVHAAGAFSETISQDRLVELSADGFDAIRIRSSIGSNSPADALWIRGGSGSDAREEKNLHCIAARYSHGDGHVTVVSTPQLITNGRIAVADHLPIAASILLRGGKTIVFDEFYHGATIRGNPLWLFTRRTWLTACLSLLGLASAVIWRAAIFPGPPLADPPFRRRAVGEYLEAMSGLLRQSRGHEIWSLQNVCEGVLWRLRKDYGLPPDQKEREPLLSAIARKDPESASVLEQVLNEVSRYSRLTGAVSERQTGALIQRMMACLSKTGTKRSAVKFRK